MMKPCNLLYHYYLTKIVIIKLMERNPNQVFYNLGKH